MFYSIWTAFKLKFLKKKYVYSKKLIADYNHDKYLWRKNRKSELFQLLEQLKLLYCFLSFKCGYFTVS